MPRKTILFRMLKGVRYRGVNLKPILSFILTATTHGSHVGNIMMNYYGRPNVSCVVTNLNSHHKV